MTGVKFGDYHSFDDFGLILTDEEIPAPEAKTYTVEVDGRDGDLDLTEALGDVCFKNITLVFNFTMRNAPKRWISVISDFSAAVHGKSLEITRDTDPDYYYYGRVQIKDASRLSEALGSFKVECNVEPYKYYTDETVIEAAAPAEVTLTNDRMRVIPTVTTDAEILITCGNTSVSLSEGTWEVPALELSEGTAEWTITNTANVTITYRQGRL